MNMKKPLIVLVAAVLIGVAIITVNTYNSSNSKANSVEENNFSQRPIGINPNVIKTKAIDFKLKDLNGNEFSLSDLKGKNVFLNFWATWCPPCKAEMPEIEK